MNKISPWWLLAAIVVGGIAAFVIIKYSLPDQTVSIAKRKNYDIVTLKLPNSKDPSVFGPSYWESYHTITEMIPCYACRQRAIPFISFFHDLVNKKTGKPIYNKDNYNSHIDFISNLSKEA